MPSTPKLVPHHDASSPVSEEVRLALGLEGRPLRSIEADAGDLCLRSPRAQFEVEAA